MLTKVWLILISKPLVRIVPREGLSCQALASIAPSRYEYGLYSTTFLSMDYTLEWLIVLSGFGKGTQ